MQPFEKSRCVNHKHTDSLWTRCGLRDFCARNAIFQNYACKVYCKFVREHTCTLYILVFYIQTILHIVYAMHVKHIFEMFQSKGPNNDPSASQIWNFSVAFHPTETIEKHDANTWQELSSVGAAERRRNPYFWRSTVQGKAKIPIITRVIWVLGIIIVYRYWGISNILHCESRSEVFWLVLSLVFALGSNYWWYCTTLWINPATNCLVETPLKKSQ